MGILLFLGMDLLGCGGQAGRTGDVTPLSGDVAVQESSPAAEVTPLPEEAAQATSTPLAEAPAPAGNVPVLTFSISGGAVGFCDELNINREGEYNLRICDGEELSGKLSQADRASLLAWHQNLADISLNREDNSGGADNLKTSLIFDGQGEVAADERQQQVIYDWVNGLVVRLRPQQLQPTPTPAPIATSPEGLCPDVEAPALLTFNVENPSTLILVDPDSQNKCEIPLSQPPAGRVAAAAGSLFYPVFEPVAKTLTVWQLTPAGEQVPLEFTSVPMEEPMPFDFIISPDGTRMAWSHTMMDLEASPPLYTNNLWLANIDGSDQVSVLEQVENEEQRFVVPIRFSSDGESLYYALQPDLGGPLNGRLDNLYQVPAAGGAPELLYACDTAENPVCVGGLSPDGSLFTVIQPVEGTLQLLERNGNAINNFTSPATDYMERTAFSSEGKLAFVSATLTEGTEEAPPRPNPGYVSLAVPPYSDGLQTLLAEERVATLMGWLDENRLVVGLVGEEGQPSTAILTTEGQLTEISPDIAVAVWP